MAVKFPLKMSDGTSVRTIEELREHFDLRAVLDHYSNGKLLKWLEERYYVEEAQKVKALKVSSKNFSQELCEILGVSYLERNDEGLKIDDIISDNERYEELKKYTVDEKILSRASDVVFTQEELDKLGERMDSLESGDDGNKVVYLCGEHFIIPRLIGGVTYRGVNNPKIEFEVIFDEEYCMEPAAAGIDFQNVNFSFDNYVTEYRAFGEDDLAAWYGFWADLEYNPDLVVKLLQISAEKGSAESWMALGECYKEGFGVEKDIEEAVRWYQKAAERGSKYAQEQLSMLNVIIREEKREQKYEEERKRLAQQEDVFEQVSLGMKYMLEDGVEIDEEEAAKWFIEAAKQGDKDSVTPLEILYRSHKDDEIGIKVMEGLHAAIDAFREKAVQGDEKAKLQILEFSVIHCKDKVGQKAAEVLRMMEESEKCQ